jgi:hypothetical protein
MSRGADFLNNGIGWLNLHSAGNGRCAAGGLGGCLRASYTSNQRLADLGVAGGKIAAAPQDQDNDQQNYPSFHTLPRSSEISMRLLSANT